MSIDLFPKWLENAPWSFVAQSWSRISNISITWEPVRSASPLPPHPPTHTPPTHLVSQICILTGSPGDSCTIRWEQGLLVWSYFRVLPELQPPVGFQPSLTLHINPPTPASLDVRVPCCLASWPLPATHFCFPDCFGFHSSCLLYPNNGIRFLIHKSNYALHSLWAFQCFK